MALALTVLNGPNGVDNSQRRTVLAGTAVFSGSYTAGGEAITWTGLKTASSESVQLNTLTPTAPLWVEFQIAQPGATPLWYQLPYNYTTNKLQVSVTGTAAGLGFEELAAGAYPADLTGAKVRFKVEFANEA